MAYEGNPQQAVELYVGDDYIQHNPDVADGKQGFIDYFNRMQAEYPEKSVEFVRCIGEGDLVALHTHQTWPDQEEYVTMDFFRFDSSGKIVEHWDNLAEVTPPNPSGRTQFDGVTDVADKEKTASNKKVVETLMNEVFLNGKMDNLATLINPTKYIQHNSGVADGLDGLGAALKYFAENDMVMKYTKVHKILGEGNFVLTISEGNFGKAPGDHVAYYDLFRLENGQIVEHWDVIQPIPVEAEWKNTNGKF